MGGWGVSQVRNVIKLLLSGESSFIGVANEGKPSLLLRKHAPVNFTLDQIIS